MYLLFLIFPFCAFLYALWRLHRPSSKNIVWLYSGFFGYCIQVDEGYIGDAARYVEYFERDSDTHYSFFEALGNLYSNAATFDIMADAVNAAVRFFSHDYHVLLMTYGFIYGYFFSRNIDFILQCAGVGKAAKYLPTLVYIAIFLVVPLWNMNGFRFWTATQIFLYAVLPFLVRGDRLRLIFIPVAILLHSSFYLTLPLMVAFLFFRSKGNFLIALVSMSLLLKVVVSQSFIASVVSQYLPGVFVDRYALYLHGDSSKVVGGTFLTPIVYIYTILIQVSIVMLWLEVKKRISNDDPVFRLLVFGLVSVLVVNVFSVIPSVARFYVLPSYFYFIGLLFALVRGLVNLQGGNRIFVLVSLSVFYVQFLVVLFAEGLHIINYKSVFMSPVILLMLS